MTAATSSSSSSSSLLQRTTSAPLSTPDHLLTQFTSPLASRQYSRQYAALYDFRLRKLRKGRLLQKAKSKWEDDGGRFDADDETTPRPTHTPRILDVKTGRVTYVAGIVYVEMKLKPDVLADLTREQYLPPLPPVTSYADPTSDSIYIEDESGRLKLVGPVLTDTAQHGQWITGTVGAFLGTELDNGDFHVLDVCWPGVAKASASASVKQRKNTTTTAANGKRAKLDEEDAGDDDDDDDHDSSSAAFDSDDRPDDQYAVLLSGLDLGSNASTTPLRDDDDDGNHGNDAETPADPAFASTETRLSLLTEWISGEIGNEAHRNVASRIAGVVVAGNLLAVQRADGSLFNPPPAPTATATATSKKAAQSAASRANAALTPTPPSVLLSHLTPLSATLPIVLLPGPSDPVSAALPQQSIHRAVLRGADEWSGDAAHGGIQLYNNPSWVRFGKETNILATSGQSLDDVVKYLPRSGGGSKDADADADVDMDADADAASSTSTSTSRTRLAHSLLKYGHIAPTCPDTLWCYPFTDRDPFIIGGDEQETTPDVFVVGNQPQFETSVYREVESGVQVRVVLLPRFSVTGEVALLNLRNRRVKRVEVGW